MKLFKSFNVLFITIGLFCSCSQESGILISNIDEFNDAIAKAQPGDVIELASGVWTDAELLIDAKGSKENPVVVRAKEKGKLFIEGSSNLTIAGEHLIVEGFVFRNGYTPTSEVITFKKKKGIYANNCRLTECVIDNFNGPERFEQDTWIAISGKNNRVDHCYLVDKRNQGVTMTVRMIDELCRENNHRIDHNYFGYRQNLGSNGGETLRIGTSHYSLTTSGTQVDSNYFEKCDGEHEIISNKSCGNVFLNNTFVECRGTLTYRHGNDNVAKGNFFFGNNKEHTGGIRIINKRNKAINNYMADLKGYRFRGALVIMNGVPNSAINRYHQVDGGEFTNNTFVNCDHIQLCAGSDEERSATPINSKIDNNLFYHDSFDEVFTIYDDISGIEIKNNFAGSNLNSLDDKGVTKLDIKLKENEFGVFVPENKELEGIGCSMVKPAATADNTGVNWYPKGKDEMKFGTGNRIKVKAGQNTLFEALKNSNAGDILVLTESADYTMNKTLVVNHPVTITAKSADVKPVLKSEKAAMFVIENGGGLQLKGLEFDGKTSPDKGGNSIIRTSRYSMNQNYKLLVEDCTITDLDINHSFDFIKISKNTMADSILIRNCEFNNVTGNIARLDKETESLGIFNAEYVILENSVFSDVQGAILSLVRRGTDESTFGPTLKVKDCEFNNIGHGKRNKLDAAFYIHGVQVCDIKNNKFNDSKALQFHLTNGEPITKVASCSFTNSLGIKSNSKEYQLFDIRIN